MKFCMLRSPVKKIGELRYRYHNEEIDIAFYESYSKQLDMYFYQLQNLGSDFISVRYGYDDSFISLAPNQITDLSFAEYPENCDNFYLKEHELQSIIRDNIFYENKTLRNYVKCYKISDLKYKN